VAVRQRPLLHRVGVVPGGRFVSSESELTVITVNGIPEVRSSVVRTSENELMHVADHACRELGIDEWACDKIADQKNTLDDLRRIVDNLITYGDVDGDPTPQGYYIDPAADGAPDPDHAFDVYCDAAVGL
jgi:hypothetical protein